MNKKLNKRFNKYNKKQYGSGTTNSPNQSVNPRQGVSNKARGFKGQFGSTDYSNNRYQRVPVMPGTNKLGLNRANRVIPVEAKTRETRINQAKVRTLSDASAQPANRPSGEAAAANISKLLEMLDIDKNNIAKQLKGKLGTTNNEVTRKVDELFKHLEQLKNHINSTIPQDENDDSFLKLKGRDVYAKKKFTLKSGVYKKINEDDSPSDERELGVFTGLDNLKAQSVNKPETLDTQIENKETLLNGADQIELDEAGVNTLQNRLLNCQKLEFYYLKKHDEVIKIFTFLLNLFDKYKYQGELLLFLLKYLVTKPDKPDRPYKSPTIRIPKSIILNIKKLIQDQDTIQDVIDQMSTDINSNNPLTATSDPSVDIKLGSEHVTSPNSYEHNYQESRAGSTGNTGSTAV
jgi:hypothetical protein